MRSTPARPAPVHPTPVGLALPMHPERPCIRRPRAQSVHASLAYASYTRACAVVPSLLRRASISEPPVLEHILHTCARMSFRTVRGFYLRWARDSQQTRSNPEARHNCGRGKQTKGRAGRWEARSAQQAKTDVSALLSVSVEYTPALMLITMKTFYSSPPPGGRTATSGWR